MATGAGLGAATRVGWTWARAGPAAVPAKALVNRNAPKPRDIELNLFISNENPSTIEYYIARPRPASRLDDTAAEIRLEPHVANQSLSAAGYAFHPEWRIQVSASHFLDGSMIARTETRAIDERQETRHAAVSSTAVLEFRGRKHVIRLINLSPSGAMALFPHAPNIGERLPLQILDRGLVSAQVRWVRDGRIGLSFAGPRG